MAYTYPRIVSPDYSPSQDIMSYQEPFDKNFLPDGYTISPDYSLSTFFDTESFYDQPLLSTEQASLQGYSMSPTTNMFNPALPATGMVVTNSQARPQQPLFPPPFGQLGQDATNFQVEAPTLDTVELSTFSPKTYATSPTPSLCGDTQPNATSPSVPIQHTIKYEYPSAPSSPTQCINMPTIPTPSDPPQPRKRGRPRLDRRTTHPIPSPKKSSLSASSSTTTTTSSSRLPHNQVERKYRQGLNSELERLRRAVPTLPQADEGMGHPKPSKAMVLSSAIEYIKRVERERDELRGVVEKLRGKRGGGGGGGGGGTKDEAMDIED